MLFLYHKCVLDRKVCLLAQVNFQPTPIRGSKLQYLIKSVLPKVRLENAAAKESLNSKLDLTMLNMTITFSSALISLCGGRRQICLTENIPCKKYASGLQRPYDPRCRRHQRRMKGLYR